MRGINHKGFLANQIFKEGDGEGEDQWPLTQESKAGKKGGSEGRPEPIRGGAAAAEEYHARYEAWTGFGCLLVDAENAFCKQYRYLTLHECRARWPRASRLIFN